MKTILYSLLLSTAQFLTAQTATKEQIISDLPEIEITEGINLHIISPEPIQYVDLSTLKLTGDLPATNIARIKITDSPESNETKNKKADNFYKWTKHWNYHRCRTIVYCTIQSHL